MNRDLISTKRLIVITFKSSSRKIKGIFFFCYIIQYEIMMELLLLNNFNNIIDNNNKPNSLFTSSAHPTDSQTLF